jgi:hemolysin activation/secretion protein
MKVVNMKKQTDNKQLKLSLGAIILLSSLSSSLLLADVPTVGGDPMQGMEPPSKPKSAPIINIEEKAYKPLPSVDDNRTIYVKGFTIVGSDNAIDINELQALLKPYENRELTMKQLEEAAALITKRYRESGYFVARAYIPTNALDSSDMLTIKIIKGTYGKFKVENSSLASNGTIQDILDDLKGKPITSGSLERVVLLTDDLAGVDVASADIMPGDGVGESDFLIKTVPTPRFDGYVTADNYGSIYTGLYRYTLGANANSVLGIGDKLSVMAMITDGNGLKNGSVTYGAPIMSNGLYLSGGYYNTQYSLGNSYSNLNAIGNTSAGQLTLTYPVIKTKLENLNLSINPQMQLLSDKQLGENTQKRAGLSVFGVDYSKMTEFGNTPTTYKANVSYTLGNLDFRDPIDAGYDKASINTQGTFSKISTSLTGSVELIESLTLKNTFNAQFALQHKNLDGSQDITIGGAYAVKVYPSTQQSGDSGYINTIELGYTLPTIYTKYNHSVSVFYDIGRSFMTNTQTPSGQTIPFNAQILQDIGLGYSASYDNFFGKVWLAQAVGGIKVAGVPYYTTKGLFQVGWVW